MRKAVRFTATLIIFVGFIAVAVLIGYIKQINDSNHIVLFSAGGFALYFILLLLLGAWSSRTTWEDMGGVRKMLLIFLVLPGFIAFSVLLLMLAMFGAFAAEEVEKARIRGIIDDL